MGPDISWQARTEKKQRRQCIAKGQDLEGLIRTFYAKKENKKEDK
jgi:hypothetical protein